MILIDNFNCSYMTSVLFNITKKTSHPVACVAGVPDRGGGVHNLAKRGGRVLNPIPPSCTPLSGMPGHTETLIFKIMYDVYTPVITN